MLDKLDAALRFQQEALNLRAQRQEILAANIANADTPGFQARDIDFSRWSVVGPKTAVLPLR